MQMRSSPRQWRVVANKRTFLMSVNWEVEMEEWRDELEDELLLSWGEVRGAGEGCPTY